VRCWNWEVGTVSARLRGFVSQIMFGPTDSRSSGVLDLYNLSNGEHHDFSCPTWEEGITLTVYVPCHIHMQHVQRRREGSRG